MIQAGYDCGSQVPFAGGWTLTCWICCRLCASHLVSLVCIVAALL